MIHNLFYSRVALNPGLGGVGDVASAFSIKPSLPFSIFGSCISKGSPFEINSIPIGDQTRSFAVSGLLRVIEYFIFFDFYLSGVGIIRAFQHSLSLKPCHEKICFQGFRPDLTQTGLYIHQRMASGLKVRI